MRRFSTSAGGAIRVLVVDDDAVLVRSLERVLSLQGFEVDTATDGRTALTRLQDREYDVMLLDLRMGGMDGLEMYGLAPPQCLPATIIHSAHIDVRTAVLATRAGVQDVMQKPVPEDSLALRIRELAAEHRSIRQYPKPETLTPKSHDALSRVVGSSAKTSELREQVRRVAQFRDVPVLVQGATGTGKELVAQALHALTCPSEPFVSVNCAAVPEQLFESELFGHEAGAFTSARAPHMGLFEEAGSGTLFLDEIGEMPVALQAKLLRVLEVRQFRRVGGTRTKVFAARVVSATNRPLTSSLGGSMRPDLFFRLAGYALRVPTLAERARDIPELAQHFLADFAVRHQVKGLTFSDEALALLVSYPWPGNIRELRAVVENAAILTRSGQVGRDHVQAALEARSEGEPGDSWSGPVETAEPESEVTKVSAVMPVAKPTRSASLPDMQRDIILRAFEESQRNLSKAALDLGIPRSTLRARLRRYGVR
ncbi:MAG TPA: sigma-54 dependent transcriptional regulator [Polyangiaceae bacterium]|nr:sigma-54 dependent transcriptional regulator [Polyangiaceae bacterium]